ncbi:hypothetical protein GF356_02120 [candidate division GN15 bacterium]|nr:hypothetical protein [candidate division GN15 bacterium]
MSRRTIPALFVLLAIYYALPLLLKIDWWGVRDWDLFTTIAAVPTGTVLNYGQFPFWNPYLGGGNILFHHPEVTVLSPFFLFYLLFGPLVGLKLQVLLCYAIGFGGSYLLARSFGLSRIAGVLFSVAYFGSVHFALHIAEGHMPFTHYCFLPWFVAFVVMAREQRHHIIWAAAALALMVLGNGGAVPLLYTLFFGGMLCLLLSIQHRTVNYLLYLAAATLGGLGLAAVKFLPGVVYLIENTWEGNPNESIPLSALDNIFFGFEHSLFVKHFEQQTWAWHEYGAYISPFLVLLALTTLIWRFRSHWPWLVIAAFFFLFGLGDHGSASPWAILTSLPGFSSLRGTGRAFHFVILSFAMLGAIGYDLLSARLAASRAKLSAYIVNFAVLVIVVTNIVFAWGIISEANHHPPPQIHRSEQFRQTIDPQGGALRSYLANRGALRSPWLSAYHPSRGLVTDNGQVLQHYAVEGQVDVRDRTVTPNVITYNLTGVHPGRLVIGMGYDKGWSADDGRPLTPVNGLISFAFDRGPETLVLRYRTPHLWLGLAVSILTLIALILFWRQASVHKRSS